MPNPYRRKSGRYSKMRGTGGGDPLAALSDDFTGTLDDWTLYQGDGTATVDIVDGELSFEIDAGGSDGSMWYSPEEGCLLHKTVSGLSWEVVATLRIANAADSGLPPATDFRLAGIAAHDPDRATALNYVHVALGATNEADLRAEHKSTVDSESEPGGGSSPGYSSISWPSGEGQIRILRDDQTFTLSVRETDADPWTDIEIVDRSAAPLPETLQVGPIVYSANPTHDVRGFFSSVTFATV